MKRLLQRSFDGIVALFMMSGTWGSTVWTGPGITFTKAPGADWTLAANQDFLTVNVSLTRSDRTALINYTAGQTVTDEGPADTEWAVGSIAEYHTLAYGSFFQANDAYVGYNFPGRTFVVHLITDDIYFELTGLSWQRDYAAPPCDAGTGVCGGFSYGRTTASVVPIPATFWLFVFGLLGMVGIARRKKKA